jgi:hypothetical protein
MAVPSFERPFHPQKRFLEGKKGLQASFVPNCILPAAVINQLFIYVNGLTGRQTMTHAVSRNSSDLQKKDSVLNSAKEGTANIFLAQLSQTPLFSLRKKRYYKP